MAIVDEKDQKERTEADSTALDLSAGPSYLEVPGEVSLGAAGGDQDDQVPGRRRAQFQKVLQYL